MARKPSKPLMRSLGEFVGHIVRGARTDPAPNRPDAGMPAEGGRREVDRQVRETEGPDGVIYRRTTIDEIEVRQRDAVDDRPSNPTGPDRGPDDH